MSKTAESKPAPRASARGASARSPARGNGGERDVRTRLVVLETEMKHFATKEDIAKLRTDMAEFKTEIKADIADIRADMQRMNAEIERIKETMATKEDLQLVRTEMQATNADMHQRFNEMQRWFVATVLSGVGFLSVLIAVLEIL